MKKTKWFKDSPGGVQLHTGQFRGDTVWHSDDGGKTWWSGYMFPHTAEVTQKELVELAVSILQYMPSNQ